MVLDVLRVETPVCPGHLELSVVVCHNLPIKVSTLTLDGQGHELGVCWAPRGLQRECDVNKEINQSRNFISFLSSVYL